MIKYLTSILVVIALSCNTTKKNASKSELRRTDKENVASNLKIHTDSISIGSKKSTQLITNDSDYYKTTIIREFYTDEFDFSTTEDPGNNTKSKPDSFPKKINSVTQSSLKLHKSPGGIKYRETTIIEKGKVSMVNDKSKSTGLVTSNSKQENKKASSTILHTETKTQKEINKSSVSILSGFSLILLLILISFFIYSKYKKLTLWQVLKQLIK